MNREMTVHPLDRLIVLAPKVCKLHFGNNEIRRVDPDSSEWVTADGWMACRVPVGKTRSRLTTGGFI